METDGNRWKPMEIHGKPWKPMKTNGNQKEPKDIFILINNIDKHMAYYMSNTK